MRYMKLFYLILLGTLLGGCSSVNRYMGFEKVGPNEYETVRHEPLEIPDHSSLETPRLGIKRPQTQHMAEKIKSLVVSDKKRMLDQKDAHEGETALMKNMELRPLEEDNIRHVVDSESYKEVTFEEKLRRAIAFWKTPKKGKVIDSDEEQKRLEKEKAASRLENKE
jgi:hypothetical protein